jgi:hypothetical protein
MERIIVCDLLPHVVMFIHSPASETVGNVMHTRLKNPETLFSELSEARRSWKEKEDILLSGECEDVALVV